MTRALLGLVAALALAGCDMNCDIAGRCSNDPIVKVCRSGMQIYRARDGSLYSGSVPIESLDVCDK
jgi:hypothetical protein